MKKILFFFIFIFYLFFIYFFPGLDGIALATTPSTVSSAGQLGYTSDY